MLNKRHANTQQNKLIRFYSTLLNCNNGLAARETDASAVSTIFIPFQNTETARRTGIYNILLKASRTETSKPITVTVKLYLI